MTVKKPKQIDGKNKLNKKKIIPWIIYSLTYAIVLGIIYGTVSMYFGTEPLLFGLYIDLPVTFLYIAIFGIVIITFLVFGGEPKPY